MGWLSQLSFNYKRPASLFVSELLKIESGATLPFKTKTSDMPVKQPKKICGPLTLSSKRISYNISEWRHMSKEIS